MPFQILNTEETITKIVGLIRDATKEVMLVSPYFNIDTDSRPMQAVRNARARKVPVTIIIREDHNDRVAWDVLNELMGLGVKVQKVPQLHAKLYWSDAGAVVSSINLLTTSFEKSIEVGMFADDAAAREDVARLIRKEVQPRTPVDHDGHPRSRSSDHHARGHCIRCSDSIAFNPDKPLCGDCYGVWREYEDPEYEEEFCHQCGKENETCVARPLCRKCFKSAA